MKMIFDRLAKGRIFYPLRKFGLYCAKHWPFPVHATLFDCSHIWVDLRSAVGRAILVKGDFDQGVWREIEPFLRPGSVFLDVGANVGYYTMLASSRVGTSGQVHAFEIDPRPLRCLKRNSTECINRNIAIHEIAVGEVDGSGVLVMEPDCGHSSVQHKGPGMKVQMVSLDSWMAKPGSPSHIDVIKIDIEGGELAALEGARKLIARFRPIIVCEALDGNIHKNVPGQASLLEYFAGINYTTHFAEGVHSPTIVAAAK